MTTKVRQQAFLRSFQNSGQCKLYFPLKIHLPEDKTITVEDFQAARQLTDTVGSMKQHIRNKIEKIIKDDDGSDSSDQNGNKIDSEISIEIRQNQTNINDDIVLKELFNKMSLTIIVFDQQFDIQINTPTVESITIPEIIFVNCSVQPTNCKMFSSDQKKSLFKWSKSLDTINWKECGDKYALPVTNDMVKYYLKLTVVPVNANGQLGSIYEVVSEKPVQTLPKVPSHCPFEQRHQYTRTKLTEPNRFRVVSYNILSERYTHKDDQFDYCPPMALTVEYRKMLILKELIGYNSDIICLQEVDNRLFHNYYKQNLRQRGFSGNHFKKGGKMPEGTAIFFNTSKFKLFEETKRIVLNEEIKRYSDLLRLLRKKEEIEALFLKQSTSLQVTMLERKDAKAVLLVGNTHLYYKPEEPQIRLLQIVLITKYLFKLKRRIEESKHVRVSVILCGDFNAQPNSSVHKFLVEGTIDPSHPDCLRIADDETALFGHEFNFVDASGSPKYTNYTKDFRGCLDYIFSDHNIRLEGTVPPISSDVVEKYQGCPNEVFPSDHLALAADFRFIN